VACTCYSCTKWTSGQWQCPMQLKLIKRSLLFRVHQRGNGAICASSGTAQPEGARAPEVACLSSVQAPSTRPRLTLLRM